MILKKWKGTAKYRRGIIMATQLAPTPILFGAEAKDLLNELKRKPTKKSIENGIKLMDFFNKIEKK